MTMLRVISRRLGLVKAPKARLPGPFSRPISTSPVRPQDASRVSLRSSQRSSGRHDAPAAAAAYASHDADDRPIHYGQPVASSSSSPSRSDDALFKAHFDEMYHARSVGASRGLFRLAPLSDPAHMPSLTDRTLIHGHAIVERITNAPLDPTGRELRLVVKNLDRLSDILCGVIDMCELVRNVSPDEEWVGQADAAYERLCSSMNELNTHQGLYKVRPACLHLLLAAA